MVPELLQDLRRMEKAQTLFYRSLAAEAEAAGRVDLVERLNGLHADEQHHLSRLTARLMELGEATGEVERGPDPGIGLDRWEQAASQREREEVDAYERALEVVGQDDVTGAILEEILASERLHLDHLGGKWMPA